MTADILAAIVASARTSAGERARAHGVPVDRAAAARRSGGAAFSDSLRQPGVRIIAECKRRSPSRGVLRAIYDPTAIARGYEAAGAAAISVLTEPAFFDGGLDHLRAVRATVRLPILQKDFIVTEFQLIEARAAGADAALLIVAALGDADLRALLAHAASLDLAALVEVHDAAELDRALAAGATLIGVNSRNLRTLDVATSVLDDLAPRLPAGVTAVAESGLRSADDISRLRRAGYRAFLIGERFMTESDAGRALAALKTRAESAAAETKAAKAAEKGPGA
jgi:indole-3-glycerol phosphate synthase